jgi:hypothetical protein
VTDGSPSDEPLPGPEPARLEIDAVAELFNKVGTIVDSYLKRYLDVASYLTQVLSTEAYGWLLNLSVDSSSTKPPMPNIPGSLNYRLTVVDADKTVVLDRRSPDIFIQALIRIHDIAALKKADYSPGPDRWTNFNATGEYIDQPNYVAADFLERLKLSRAKELRNGNPTNEALLDTYLDKAVYAVLALAMFMDQED